MSKQMATKNLHNLSDILGAEKLNYEKICLYADTAKDPALINLLTELKEATAAHYGAVYNYLKSHQ